MNLTDFMNYSLKGDVDFLRNSVHHNKRTVLYFNENGRNHSRLTAWIRRNVIWANEAPIVDSVEPNATNDWDARIHFLDNTVSWSTGIVFSNFGNITVSGNDFSDCSELVLRLRNLNKHQPFITNNTFLRCNDVMWIEGKIDWPVPVLLWMDNNVIDSNGTAMYFVWMEVTMRRVVVTENATWAVVAEVSYVDAYECDFEMNSSKVVSTGHIRFWHWIEAWVEWADAKGVPSGNLVAGVALSFIDRSGGQGATAVTDELGHVEAFPLLKWSIERTGGGELRSPYTVIVTLSSITNTTRLDLDRSYRGPDALWLHLWDPYLPDVRFERPLAGDLFNTMDIVVSGFSEDIGSGILLVEIAINDGEFNSFGHNWEGDFSHRFPEVPEGLVSFIVRATDVAGNTMTDRVTVTFDRTPPRLIITWPPDGHYTNLTTIHIRGEVEPWAVLVVNILPLPSDDGTFNIELPLLEGNNTFVVSATDAAGNTASQTIIVVKDTIPPEIELFSPSDGLVTSSGSITVRGRVTGHSIVDIDVHRQITDLIGDPITPDDQGYFNVEVPIEEGTNRIVVNAWDMASNWAMGELLVIVDLTPPTVRIMSPMNGTITNHRFVTVRLTVSNDADQVYVNGARVLGTGTVERKVTLVEGVNSLVASVLDRHGNEANASIIVILDTLPPLLEITLPVSIVIQTNDPLISVAGSTEGPMIEVTVFGLSAPVAEDGTFRTELPLGADGIHEIIVKATDRAGNMALRRFTVDLSTAPPFLSVFYLPPDGKVATRALSIHGTTSETATNVTIIHEHGGVTTSYEITLARPSFTYTVMLVNGSNSIEIHVVDIYGNRNSSEGHEVKLVPPDVEETSSSVTSVVVFIVLAAILFAVAALVLRTLSEDDDGVS
jgi:hypothetical protein